MIIEEKLRILAKFFANARIEGDPYLDRLDLKLLIVKAGVRYWEDSEVNGENDTENGENIPCKIGELWCPQIEIETGKILNWEQGKKAEIHYKVADCLGYEMQAENGEVAVRRQGEGDKGSMKVADFSKLILDEVDSLVNQYNS